MRKGKRHVKATIEIEQFDEWDNTDEAMEDSQEIPIAEQLLDL